MELTYEEKLKLGNSRAHLEVVLFNIRIANEELSFVLDQIKENKKKLEEIIEFREELRGDNNKIVFAYNIRASQLDDKELALIKRENQILIKEKQSYHELEQAQKKLNDINEESRISFNNYIKTIDSQKLIITNNQTDIALLKLELENANKENQQQDILKKELENEITGLTDQKETLRKEIDNLTKDYNKKLEQIQVAIKTELQKIKNPLALVKREQEKLDIEKRDIAIVRRRLFTQHKKQNPDKLLPIELQQQ